MKKLKERTKNTLLFICALILMWAVWAIAYKAEGNEYIIPSFSSSVKSLWQLLKSAFFWRAFAQTFLRAAEAFIISFVLAAVFAALSAACKPLGVIISPFVTVLRTVPTMAVIIIILLLTTPRTAPVIVGILVTFPMIYAQIAAAFSDIDGDLKEAANLYKISARDKIFKIYIPLAAPNVLSQTGAAFSLTLKIIVSAEVMASTYVSIGGMMQEARSYLEIPRLFALTIVTVIVGALAEFALSRLARLSCRWKKGESK